MQLSVDTFNIDLTVSDGPGDGEERGGNPNLQPAWNLRLHHNCQD